MTRKARIPVPTPALDQDSTLVAVVELSARSWLVGARVPGAPRLSKYGLAPSVADLVALLGRLRDRAAAAGQPVARVVLAYEAGRDGFWLARFLAARGVEVYVIQPSSVLVDRRARRAKTDALDVEMLMRTLLAWLRGEPGVCSMVPVPSEAEEDGRRPGRERHDLIRERTALCNKIDGVLATLGAAGYRPLRRDRRVRLEELRTPEGGPLPANTKARIGRLLDRLELVMRRIAELEAARDAVVARATASGEAEAMVRNLARLKGIGAELATLLVSEAYIRAFPDRKALGAYAGLTGTPFAGGGRGAGAGHQQGRQPAPACGPGRTGLAVVALPAGEPTGRMVPQPHRRRRRAPARGDDRRAPARKLLVALWRFCRDGVVPEGALVKAA